MSNKGPFRKGQLVVNLDTGWPSLVIAFPGKGLVRLKSQANDVVFEKHYRYLEDYVDYNKRMQQ
jgi:hypothetical protein